LAELSPIVVLLLARLPKFGRAFSHSRTTPRKAVSIELHRTERACIHWFSGAGISVPHGYFDRYNHLFGDSISKALADGDRSLRRQNCHWLDRQTCHYRAHVSMWILVNEKCVEGSFVVGGGGVGAWHEPVTGLSLRSYLMGLRTWRDSLRAHSSRFYFLSSTKRDGARSTAWTCILKVLAWLYGMEWQSAKATEFYSEGIRLEFRLRQKISNIKVFLFFLSIFKHITSMELKPC
jgi:hypothetical protein